ncbi:hypothetical protein BHM03_00043243 [Ensete ventricosum]|nr:hypothetical protein BHM03_00043243 [Ensete ventricosum]
MAEVARGDRNRLRATIAAEEGAAVAAIEEEEGSDGRGGRGDGQMSCGRAIKGGLYATSYWPSIFRAACSHTRRGTGSPAWLCIASAIPRVPERQKRVGTVSHDPGRAARCGDVLHDLGQLVWCGTASYSNRYDFGVDVACCPLPSG